jgi:hypothetical protein
MEAITVELLIFTLVAVYCGWRFAKLQTLLWSSIALATLAWAIRCLIIIGAHSDIDVAEDYLNGMTTWNAGMEIAIFALWLLLSSLIGRLISRVLRSRLIARRSQKTGSGDCA